MGAKLHVSQHVGRTGMECGGPGKVEERTNGEDGEAAMKWYGFTRLFGTH